MNLKISFSFLFIMIFSFVAQADISLPAIFGNHMVLQQNAEVPFWGWARATEEVTITTSWDGNTITTKGNPNAEWKVMLTTPSAGGPYTITIKGYNTITLEDVMVGEVWLCSGQSNMEMSANWGIDNKEEAIKTASHPNIRFFNVAQRTANAPQINLDGQWQVCTPETMQHTSAVAYFFGRELAENLNVPIGLIHSSWGGSPAEAWVNTKVIEADEALASEAIKIQEMEWAPREPGKAYNAMLAPIIPFKIAGALWYQGETNTYSPSMYARLLPALINNWRNEWGYAFPFYYVQIAPFKYGRPLEGAVLRDAQRRSMITPNTGMVVTSDIGNIDDIHPTNKLDVGLRLANWALNKTYGKKDRPVSGPLFKNMEKEGKRMRIYFEFADNGLVVKGKQLTHFEIAGADQKFVPAKAKVEGNAVVVWAPKINEPHAVRFAFTNTAEPNLFNKEGLPASTFRTDDWEIVIE